jgi:hypothetical protein
LINSGLKIERLQITLITVGGMLKWADQAHQH